MFLIDIGGTTIKLAKYDKRDEILTLLPPVKTPNCYDDFITQLKYLKEKYISFSSEIAISMPGIVNSKTGYVVHGGSLKYLSNIALKDILERELNSSVSIMNDAKSAVLGEKNFGNLQDTENGLSVVLGTGIGLGIIINGQVFNGSHYASGELSFLNTNNKSELSGLLGNNLSVVNMMNSFFSKEKTLSHSNGEMFFKEILKGNVTANKLLNEFCGKLAIQLYNLQALLDPEIIVIGGGISSQAYLYKVLEKELERYGQVIHNLIRKPNIIQSDLGNKANLLGAYANYLQIKKDQSLISENE